MDFGVNEARERVLKEMHTGNWQYVDELLTRYAGAVRAEERHRAIGEAIEALTECAGDDGTTPARDCLAALERLR